MQKLKVGDTVQVISGAERTEPVASKRGKLASIDREAGRVKVEGLRTVKRHVKKGRDPQNPDGGILEKAGSIAIASVQLVCPSCDKPSRVAIVEQDGKRKRQCKKCNAAID